jgi:hypothetical protein
MTRTVGLVIAISLVLGSGICHGLWTQRWQPSEQRQQATVRIKTLPLQIGDWQGHEQEMEQRTFQAALIDAYLMRHYVRSTDGGTISVLLVSGRPGPVSVHTPDVCYAGAGYIQVKAAVRQTLPAETSTASAEFWLADFVKENSAVPTALRIRWAWSSGGPWAAPDKPRLAFSRQPVLYKLYVIREIAALNEPVEDAAQDFLKLLLPELDKILQ